MHNGNSSGWDGVLLGYADKYVHKCSCRVTTFMRCSVGSGNLQHVNSSGWVALYLECSNKCMHGGQCICTSNMHKCDRRSSVPFGKTHRWV
mmetsp:Transcript_12529/g.15077  ORF Transcript_12529/g.15077 Transcript_12529/m.15077 type:complete len:91 (+) Transcript_12529:771-1043(+)